MGAIPICGPIFVAAALVLTGCSVYVPPRLAIAPAGGQVPQYIDIGMQPPLDGAADPRFENFARALETALAARGVQHREGSDYQLSVSLALSPSSVGVTQVETGVELSDHWLAQPRRPYLLDRCKSQRLRVVLVGTAAGQSGPALTAQGYTNACSFSDAEMERLARELALQITGGGEPGANPA